MVSYSMLLMVIASYIQQNGGSRDLSSATIHVLLSHTRRLIGKCGDCLVEAGANILDTIAPDITSHLSLFHITGPDFVFSNIVPACNTRDACDIKGFKIDAPKEPQAIPQANTRHALDVANFKAICLLGVELISSYSCLSCLQESFGARSLGKFRMTTDNLKGHHSLILLYDPKSEMHPAACPEWCPIRDDIYIIDEILCKKLLEKLRFTNLDQPSLSNAADDKILLTEYGSDAVLPGEISNAVKRVRPQKKKIGVAVGRMINAMVTASKSPAQCLRVEKHFLNKYITACRKGLAKNFNTAVIAFDKDEKHMIYLFHELGELDKENLANLDSECGKIEVMEMTNPDCQLHVIDHFITLPTSDEILAKQGMRATYLEASAATGCVWVRHNPFETDCPMYLSQIEESTLHELDASNKLVSLFLLTSGEKDEKDGRVGILREHISKGICTQLHFVPNFMCLHELHINEIKRTPSPVQVSLQSAGKAGSIRITSTQLASTSDSKANVRDSQVSVFPHKELLPDHRNPHTPASVFIQDQLRNPGEVDSLPQSAAFGQVLVKSEGASTSNAPTQHTNAASIKREKVRVVYWFSSINADFLPCAECLASRTKMLLLSARRPYAWIVDGTRPGATLQCKMCLNMRIGAAIDMNFIFVEGISSEKISQMFYVNPHPPPRDFESNPNPTFLKREPKEEPMSMKREPKEEPMYMKREPKEEPVSQDPTPPHKKSRGSGSNPSPFRHVKEEPT